MRRCGRGIEEINIALRELGPKVVRTFFSILGQMVDAIFRIIGQGSGIQGGLRATIDELFWQTQNLADRIPVLNWFIPDAGQNPNVLWEWFRANQGGGGAGWEWGAGGSCFPDAWVYWPGSWWYGWGGGVWVVA